MEQSKDNIYIKLALIRSELQNMNLKKTGVNSYAKFKYFELVDFLPAINDLALKYHVVNVINFSNDEAYLSILMQTVQISLLSSLSKCLMLI